MSYRYMRIIVFFDLPTTTSQDLREYRQFRKSLILNGFLMMQESVYIRIALNATMEQAIIDQVKRNKPPHGLVQILSITEKQFSHIQTLVGEMKSDTLNDDERLVIL